jgi:hypothetical protein
MERLEKYMLEVVILKDVGNEVVRMSVKSYCVEDWIGLKVLEVS